MEIILVCTAPVVLINALAFALWGVDKRRARLGQWRVPEANLLAIAFLGGTIGAKLGQRVFRHKTRKQPFAGVLNMMCLLHAGGAVTLVVPASRLGVLTELRGLCS